MCYRFLSVVGCVVAVSPLVQQRAHSHSSLFQHWSPWACGYNNTVGFLGLVWNLEPFTWHAWDGSDWLYFQCRGWRNWGFSHTYYWKMNRQYNCNMTNPALWVICKTLLYLFYSSRIGNREEEILYENIFARWINHCGIMDKPWGVQIHIVESWILFPVQFSKSFSKK